MHPVLGIGDKFVYSTFFKYYDVIYHHLQQDKIDVLAMDSKIFPNLGFAYSCILFFYHCFLFTNHHLTKSNFYCFHCLNKSPVC